MEGFVNKWIRSLSFAVLVCASLYSGTVRVEASESWCEDEAEACGSRCGSTVSYQLQYMVCINYYPFPHQWECEEWVGVYEWALGSGVESFSCDEVSQQSYCVCAYKRD
jgi:hypothetical protein